MRVYSASGTFPAKTKDSVPRLSALKSVRTLICLALGAGKTSVRSSAAPGDTYHSASA